MLKTLDMTRSYSDNFYKALEYDDSIRLLRLVKSSSTLRGILITTRLSEVPAYHALSYTGGSDKDCRSIELDGVTIKVRRNLWQFLNTLKNAMSKGKLEDGILLWADAICINQASSAEKNHQVKQMGLIFSRANTVHSWLGTSDGTREPSIPGIMDSTSRPVCELHYHEQFERSYRLRRWIIQEFVLAKQVIICGNRWRRIMESCKRTTRSARRRRRNPEPARSSRTTSLSVRSG
jgi:hypothetical protein